MTTAEAMPIAFIGFSFIAALTWFFSYRPRLFIRVFVPRDERRDAIRGILRGPAFGRSMRVMALLQFGLAAAFGVVGMCLWLS